MQQQVNFYKFLSHKQQISCSADQIALASGAALGLFVVAAVLVSAFNFGLEADLKEANSQKQLLTQKIDQLTDGTVKAAQSELQALKSAIKFKQNVLQQLKASTDDNQITFSQRMAGLGRQNIKGLWLDSISLVGGGQFLSLQGETVESSLVPAYLQKLSKDSVFNGLLFDVLKIQAPEETDGDQLNFQITALPDAQAGGQG